MSPRNGWMNWRRFQGVMKYDYFWLIKRPRSMIFQPYNHIIEVKIVLQSARARGYKERSVKNYKHLKNYSNHENPGVFSNSWPKGTQKQLVQVWGVNFAFSVPPYQTSPKTPFRQPHTPTDTPDTQRHPGGPSDTPSCCLWMFDSVLAKLLKVTFFCIWLYWDIDISKCSYKRLTIALQCLSQGYYKTQPLLITL